MRSDDPGRVRLVDNELDVVARAELRQLGQRRAVPVHAEDALGQEQRAAAAALDREQAPGVLDVAVVEDPHDVRVIQRGEHPSFPDEALLPLFRRQDAMLQDLDRDEAIE